MGISLRGWTGCSSSSSVHFAAAALVSVWLRGGPFGRRLGSPSKDSPAACATVGINLTATKACRSSPSRRASPVSPAGCSGDCGRRSAPATSRCSAASPFCWLVYGRRHHLGGRRARRRAHVRTVSRSRRSAEHRQHRISRPRARSPGVARNPTVDQRHLRAVARFVRAAAPWCKAGRPSHSGRVPIESVLAGAMLKAEGLSVRLRWRRRPRRGGPVLRMQNDHRPDRPQRAGKTTASTWITGCSRWPRVGSFGWARPRSGEAVSAGPPRSRPDVPAARRCSGTMSARENILVAAEASARHRARGGDPVCSPKR